LNAVVAACPKILEMFVGPFRNRQSPCTRYVAYGNIISALFAFLLTLSPTPS
jgi:hypothetical protein